LTVLQKHVRDLQERLAAQGQENSDLTAFRTQALSRLATQHEEITRLRATRAA
jgi:hypothetical protein